MGLATTEEMCLAFLLYYPLIEVTSCASFPNTTHPLMSTSDWSTLHQLHNKSIPRGLALTLVSNRSFDGNSTSDQEEIAGYEELMKTLPQIQVASDDNVSASR